MESTNTNPTTIEDPFDSAMKATVGPRTYFGQIGVDVWHCALVKGAGKVPFDPGQHRQDQRCTAIDMTLSPLIRDNGAALRPMNFSLIAESREWARIIKPSLVGISADLRSIRDRYVQVQLVPTGRTYTNSNGDVKDANTLKFVAVYQSEAECQAAADGFFSRGRGGDSPVAGASAPALAAPAQNDAERATVAKFLPGLWAASGKSVKEFEKLIKQTDPCNKYFDLSSPEVLAVISA